MKHLSTCEFGTIYLYYKVDKPSTMVKAIIDFINDPSWDNFAKILEGLTVILIGVAIAMLAVNAANPVAWIVLAIAAVAALAALIIEN